MNNVDTIKLNFCLIPSGPVAKEIIELAERLPKHDQRFCVDGVSRVPHLTSFMGNFSLAAVDEIIDRLSQLPPSRPLQLKAYGLTISANQYAEIGYNRTADLERLQSSVATAIAGLRVSDSAAPDPGMSEIEADNQKAYGYKLFGDEYRPHVTLAAYGVGCEIVMPPEKSFYHLDFLAESLYVAESDHLGSVTRIVRRIPLL